MKRLFFLFPLLIGIASAFAQGIVVFDNRTVTLSSPPDRLVRFDPVTVGTDAPNPFGTNNAPVVGTTFLAQLYYGSSTATENSLVPVSSAPATFRNSTTANHGAWIQGVRTLDGFGSGETLTLQVRVWDSTFGSTFESTGGNGVQGRSLMFLYTIPGPVGAPPDAFFMENFRGFVIGVPEPSTTALFGVALCICWIIVKTHTKPHNARANVRTSDSCVCCPDAASRLVLESHC